MKGMLILAGNPGCGKTYICSAALDWMFGKTADIYCTKEHVFMSKIKESFDLKGDSDEQIKYLIDHDFYIYDDLGSTGFGMNRESTDVTWKQKVWFLMVEERLVSARPTIITTNYKRSQIRDNCGERTYSRLYSQDNCIIEMFSYPDLRKPLSWNEGRF